MASKKKKADLKVKKKKWVTMVAPQFNNHVLGETNVVDTEQTLGKNISMNLMYLAGDPRKQNTTLNFKVNEQKSETVVNATLLSYTVQQPSLRKMVRRGKSKVGDSFKCYTADKKPVTVKVFALARKVITMEVQRSVRREIRHFLVEHVAKKNFMDFMKEVIDGKLQREVKKVASKVYPLKMVEFYTVGLTPEKGQFEMPGKEPPKRKMSKKEKKALAEEEAEEEEKAKEAEESDEEESNDSEDDSSDEETDSEDEADSDSDESDDETEDDSKDDSDDEEDKK
jgi:ribosomal protein S3AE